MTTLKPSCLLGLLMTVLVSLSVFFVKRSFAQNSTCHKSPQEVITPCPTYPNGEFIGDMCESTYYNVCYSCTQGVGQCPQTKPGTFQTTYTASVHFDTSCEGCVGCCASGGFCSGNYQTCNFGTCACQSATPIIIDTTGKGFHLTSSESGVMFDILGDGHPALVSWTAIGSGNAFLALDRNHNGTIDSGKELFGNATQQSPSSDPNGFLALAEFDKPENGGNGDGIIDSRDAVFSHLLLWIDENHDGVSQPNELHSLPQLGVFSLGLRYRNDRSGFDQYGNWFHYQAAVNPDRQDGESKDGRVAYDVFFVPGKRPPAGGSYQGGVLDDDPSLAPFRAGKISCGRLQTIATIREAQK